MTNSQSTLPALEDLKAQARRLQSGLKNAGNPTRYNAALELVAHQHGYRDWNTLHAAAGNQTAPCPYHVGDRRTGRYLGQSFTATVCGVAQHAGGRFRVTFDLDNPVDVVTFDSFSSFRKRIVCTIDHDGRTVEKTLDGRPHMELT